MIYLPFWSLLEMIASIPVEPDSIFEEIRDFFVFLCAVPAIGAFIYGYFMECLWVEIFNPFPEKSLKNPINNIIDITDF